MGFGTGFSSWGSRAASPTFVPSPTLHVQEAISRLLAQYQNKPQIVNLITALVTPWQDLEDAGYTVLQLRNLEQAFGDILDGFGALVELQRGGLADGTYRIRLTAKILANAAQGNVENARAVFDFLMQGLNAVRFHDASPGAIILATNELPQQEGEAFAKIVQGAAPVGRRIVLEWELPLIQGPSFGWNDDNSSSPWAEWGADPTQAGLWAEGYDGK